MAEVPNVNAVVITLIALAVLFMHAQVNNWDLLGSLKKLNAADDGDLGYDQQCKSRAEYRSYLRKAAPFKPSDNLRKRLHEYERFHASCVPAEKRTSCQFLMYIPPKYGCGIGNKIMGLVSTFALALLTNRILILPKVQNLDLLLCEPFFFRGSSWILPDNLSHLTTYDDSIRLSHFTNGWLPEVALAQLSNFANAADLEFFTQEQQKNIEMQVRWLILETDQYVMPAFFHVPTFRDELQRLFPEQEAIFHLLVRHLVHPSNPVWEMTARFYDAYLRQADLMVAIQMRIHHPFRELRGDGFGPEYVHEVFQCMVEQEVLPNVTGAAAVSRRLPRYAARRHVSVLVASLDSGYLNVLRGKYIQNGAVDGSFVAVHQASAEKSQQTGDLEHDKKALMDMLLLSMADVLVTSPISTFGYTAQGLCGTRPLQVECKRRDNSSQPICGRKASMEPCYHTYPTDKVVDNVQLCECDFGYGLKAATEVPAL